MDHSRCYFPESHPYRPYSSCVDGVTERAPKPLEATPRADCSASVLDRRGRRRVPLPVRDRAAGAGLRLHPR
ncbi:hypothetical protein BV882_17830, partial [Streptomyces sp. 46]